MSAADFRAAGLTKLTPTELGKLDAWLAAYIARLGRAAVSGGVEGNPAVIESKIDGDFECWDGETIFKLMNGQIWQQASYAYKYCYKFMPSVTIYRTNGRYKMIVDGVDGSIYVTRIK
jgi:hypothetical protein